MELFFYNIILILVCQEGIDFLSAFSEHLTFLRENRAIPQKELAKILGLSLHTYQRFEYGEQDPRMSTLVALADYYNISLDDLVCREWPR